MKPEPTCPHCGLNHFDTTVIGGRIAHLRATKGWSMRELAKRARVFPGSLSRIENGQTLPTVTTLKCLCIALECTSDEILFDLEEKS